MSERVAISALRFGIVLIPLQWIPSMPASGMAAADVFFALAALAMLLARPQTGGLSWAGLGAALGFGAWAVISAAWNGGEWAKTLGHLELVAVAIMTAMAAGEGEHERAIRRALVAAAVIGAVTGLVGAAVFFFGWETPLLNHSGDLIGGGYPRIRGTAITANQLASMVATGGLLLWADPQLVPETRWRRAVLAALGAALVLTFSRTLPFALLIGALVIVEGRRRAVVWAVAFVIALAGLFVLSRYQLELHPLAPWDARLSSEPGTRWVHGTGALQTALDHPLFGIGPGRAPAAGWTAHMTWINVAAILGVPAVLALSVLFVRGLRNRACSSTGPWLALLVLATDTLHRDVEDMRHLWVILGLCALRSTASAKGASRRADRSEARHR